MINLVTLGCKVVLTFTITATLAMFLKALATFLVISLEEEIDDARQADLLLNAVMTCLKHAP